MRAVGSQVASHHLNRGHSTIAEVTPVDTILMHLHADRSENSVTVLSEFEKFRLTTIAMNLDSGPTSHGSKGVRTAVWTLTI
jgi:hypothetical protein